MAYDPPPVDNPQLCGCGKPLHYASAAQSIQAQLLVETTGWWMLIWVDGVGAWVPKHYVALHLYKRGAPNSLRTDVDILAVAREYGWPTVAHDRPTRPLLVPRDLRDRRR